MLTALTSLTSCDKDLEQENDVLTNYNILWSTIDQKYCFFEMKKDSIIDWNEAYNKYLVKALKCRTVDEVFYVFGDLLNELKDGHVNLTSQFDVSRYDLQGDYKENFVKNTIYSKNYLGKDYRRAGGLSYTILKKDSIGYIYYPSFSTPFSETNINHVLNYLKNTKGIIIDIRGNGGGQVTYADKLASHFTDKKTLTGYYQRKTGKSHDAFSEPTAQYISPSNGFNEVKKPVVVLTNRDVFSAANLFTTHMKAFKNVTIIGDMTGGGSGMPTSDELPCGWTVRFSSSIFLDKDGNCAEWGIMPDINADLDLEKAYLEDIDTIIEKARAYILGKL